MADCIDKYRTERTGTLWGEPTTFKPYVLDKVFGDGLTVVAVIPLNTRPRFYVVRMDSAWGTEDHEDTDYEAMDEALDLIEEAVGPAWPGDDDDAWREDMDEDGWRPWPALDLGAGWESEVLESLTAQVVNRG